jgi:hypothetical protein
MSLDKITQFELEVLQLNRNIAYKEKESISKNYTRLNDLYKEILKLDIPIKQKNEMYNSVIEAHKNIQAMNNVKKTNLTKIGGLSVAALLSVFFLFNGPEATGMAVSGTTITNSVTRFAPAAILGTILIFIFIKKKIKK